MALIVYNIGKNVYSYVQAVRFFASCPVITQKVKIVALGVIISLIGAVIAANPYLRAVGGIMIGTGITMIIGMFYISRYQNAVYKEHNQQHVHNNDVQKKNNESYQRQIVSLNKALFVQKQLLREQKQENCLNQEAFKKLQNIAQNISKEIGDWSSSIIEGRENLTINQTQLKQQIELLSQAAGMLQGENRSACQTITAGYTQFTAILLKFGAVGEDLQKSCVELAKTQGRLEVLQELCNQENKKYQEFNQKNESMLKEKRELLAQMVTELNNLKSERRLLEQAQLKV